MEFVEMNLRKLVSVILSAFVAASMLVAEAQSASASNDIYGLATVYQETNSRYIYNGIQLDEGLYISVNDSGNVQVWQRNADTGVVESIQRMPVNGVHPFSKWAKESATSAWVSAGRQMYNITSDGSNWNVSNPADCNTSDDNNSTPTVILPNPTGGVYVIYRDGKFVKLTASSGEISCTDLLTDVRGGLPLETTRIQDGLMVSSTSIMIVEIPYSDARSWMREIKLIDGTWVLQNRILLTPENMNTDRSWYNWQEWYNVINVDSSGVVWALQAIENRTWLQPFTNLNGTWTKGVAIDLYENNVSGFKFTSDGTLWVLRDYEDTQTVQAYEKIAGNFVPQRAERFLGGTITNLQPDKAGGVVTLNQPGIRHFKKASGEVPVFGTFDTSFTASIGGRGRLHISATGFPVPSFYIKGNLPENWIFSSINGGSADLDVYPVSGTAGVYNVMLGAKNQAGNVEIPLTVTVTGDSPLPKVYAQATSLTQAPSNSGLKVVATQSNGVWQTNPDANMVTKYNVATNNTITKVDSLRVGNNPRGLVLDPNGQSAWVANYDDGTIQRLSMSGSTITSEPAIEVGSGITSKPAALSFDSDGTLWVALEGDSAIQQVISGVPEPSIPVTGAAASSVKVIEANQGVLVVSAGSNQAAIFTKLNSTWSQLTTLTMRTNPMDFDFLNSTRIIGAMGSYVQEIVLSNGTWTVKTADWSQQARAVKKYDANTVLAAHSYMGVLSASGNSWTRGSTWSVWNMFLDVDLLSNGRFVTTTPNGAVYVSALINPISPVFTGAMSATATIGSTVEINIPSTQTPGLFRAFTSDVLPGGLALRINGGVAQIYGTPLNPADAGVWKSQIHLSNGYGMQTSSEFTLTLVNAPRFSSRVVAAFPLGIAGTFEVSATDNANIAVTSGSMPTGFRFVNNGNGTATISGTPQAGSSGDSVITLTASNGSGLSSTQDLIVRVTGQDPNIQWNPQTTIELPELNEFDPSQFATATGGGPISYSVTPGWETNSANCEVSFAGRITVRQPGECSVRASVGEFANYASDYVDVVFTAIKDATPIDWSTQDIELPGTDQLARPSVRPSIYSGAEVTYSVISGSQTTSDCSIPDRNSLAIAVTTMGTCKVRLHTDGTSRVEAQDLDVILNVVAASRGMSWAPTNTKVALATGSLVPSVRATVQGTGTVAYALANAGTTGCKVNASTGSLTFAKTGVCAVRASIAAQGIWAADTRIVEFTIYPQQLQVGKSIGAEKILQKSLAVNQGKAIPATAKIVYSIAGKACTLSGTTIVGQSAGQCTVTATAGKVSWSAPLEIDPMILAIGGTADGLAISTSFKRLWAAGATATITVDPSSAGICSSTGSKVTAVSSGDCKVNLVVQQPRAKKIDNVVEYKVVNGKRIKVTRTVTTYGPWPALQRWTAVITVPYQLA